MKISIYNPPPKPKVVGDQSYMMVYMTPSEAGALIASLGKQLETGKTWQTRMVSRTIMTDKENEYDTVRIICWRNFSPLVCSYQDGRR